MGYFICGIDDYLVKYLFDFYTALNTDSFFHSIRTFSCVININKVSFFDWRYLLDAIINDKVADSILCNLRNLIVKFIL